jgi:hypothetical protein
MPDNDYVPGRNYKSVRIKRIKRAMDSYNEKMNMPFTKALALLREFLTIGTISLRNCQFARKFIDQKMRPYFQDSQSVIEMDKLETLFQKAEERRERRKAKKLAKAQGAAAGTPGKPGRKPKGAAPTLAPTAPSYDPSDIWAEIIEEKKP